MQRWVKFSKYLLAEGWQCVVYTPENPSVPSRDETLAEDVPAEVEVIRRPIRELYGLYAAVSGKKGKSEVNPINGREKNLRQKLMMVLRGNLFIPDPRVGWVRPSVKFLLAYLEKHPVDVIVSTGPPHSMHLIAMRLARKTGIPWLADFRDPWTRMFYFKHMCLSRRAERRHAELERQVLDSCDRVIAVSPLVREEFREMTSTPVELITNGYDPEDYSAPGKPDGFFNIVHTGLFASDGDPSALWEVLSGICRENSSFRERLRIRLCGKTDTEVICSMENAGLGGHVIDLGYVNHRTAVTEQINADLLLLPLRREPEYRATLPGKLFEYLASKRPILGIGQKDGAMARIIADCSAGSVCDWEEKAAMKDFVLRCWHLFEKGEAWTGSDRIESYSRTATAAKMASVMNSVAK